ncbi:hypothetical protein MtrunA17_Chr5g0427701 [Medicago truncatula]|uniref:Uncharacterized protein n=1 Tax=Medicago truncatula TaxID=3880 RepID=A0A396HSD8_MEDTR|nr:hypothetical protein MtrunA17_Chr5g0427701 [Medicago truncatula]
MVFLFSFGTTYRKVARVEGRGRPSLKSISNSDEEKNASFEVDEGTGVPSPKPQPLENIWIDEASPKSGSPVTEPQQPLTDEEDLSYMNSHLTYEQMLENLKKLDERMLAESESESDDNGMQCNCDFNNCTCLKSYREYLAHDYADYADELDFRVR